ncbi:SUMF1/EgtB/PvdO family nonheme iron enzyme [Oscillatoria sp. CS-180]|uniref:formylglycine-generating enzyme family protein n=1 Tax=Oscillatoria sp. CS-180 TaxID=3021720 RepID=UPI003FA7DF6C
MTETTQWTEPAQQVDRFVARFGNQAYRLLAEYAALPLVLTPELVHYLRVEFLRDGRVPWEAEVDLLLSDLCSQVGHELYAMDTQVRAYLLHQMQDDAVWQQRQREVAQVLISYVSYLSRIDPKRRQKELDAQRLAAMTYLGDESCQQAAEEIVERLKQLEQAGAARGSERGIRAELAQLTRMTQELAPQLKQPALAEFARLVQQLLRNPEAVSLEAVERAYQVGEYELVASSFPVRLPTGTQATTMAGFPPLQTLTFETGRWVAESDETVATDWPTLEAQTVQVAELYFADEAEAEPEPDSATQEMEAEPALTSFSFEVATIRREGETDQWVIDWVPGAGRLYEEPLEDDLTLEMVAIPGGSFVMGSPENEPERQSREGPQHQVQVSAFYMGRYPVTQAQWQFVVALPGVERELSPAPSHFKGAARPVERVSWWEAVEFCARLSAYTGREYRLPSESQWEYACRANTTTPFHFGATLSPELANYHCSSVYNDGPTGDRIDETSQVGQFGVANAFGLSDMHGNVWEWCLDHYHSSYEGAPTDGSAWIDQSAKENKPRIRRGGAWYDVPGFCRSAYRDINDPRGSYSVIGFRVLCVAPRALT